MNTYSIIIPHKNGLPLLYRCLESIPKRDDTEVIVVDDNSDITPSEWNQFRQDFPHVHLVLTSEGKGAGYARNVGMTKATGKWLIFSDADDYFYPNALDVIDKKTKEADYDIIYFNCDYRDGETGEPLTGRIDTIIEGIKNRDYDLLRYKSFVPWGKVIKHHLVKQHNILFDEIEVNNDIMFSALVGYNSDTIGIIDDCLYCYTYNKGSVINGMTEQKMKTVIKTRAIVNAFLHEHGIRGYENELTWCIRYFAYKPVQLIWAVWHGRYKGDIWRYSKEIGPVLIRVYMGAIKHKVKRLVAFMRLGD